MKNDIGRHLKKLFSMENQTALITGSSRGLGFEFAGALGKAGAKIILNGRDEKALVSARDRLLADGIDADYAIFDVTKSDEIDSAVTGIEGNGDTIDILINNAGLNIRGPIVDFAEEDWHKVINTNLTSVFLVSKRVVRGMLNRGSGKIICTGSMQCAHARKNIAPYGAAKGGLKMLIQSMATDFGEYNIQVNGIGPGYFKTEMTRALYEDHDFDQWICSRTPMGRWGNTDEMLGLITYLASPASSFTTGQIFYVDGGILATL